MLDVELDRFKLLLITVVAVELLAIASIANQEGFWQPVKEEQPLSGEPTNPTDFNQPVNGDIPYLLEPDVSEFTDGTNYKIPGYWVRTNSRGLREKEFDMEAEPGTERILVVGDSYTFGWGVNRSKRFTDLLEERLNEDSETQHQVINAGIPGWGMKDFHAFLKDRGVKYNPDIVVIAFTFNDVISAERTNEFKRQAEMKVPENASERKQKVLRERVELKNNFYDQATIKNSSLAGT